MIEFDIVSEDQIKKMLEDLDIKYGNTYDTELSETSTNAVQNQAITKKFKELDDKNTKTDGELVNIKSSVATTLSNAKSYADSKISETKRDVDTELEKKVDKVSGKGLSANDFNNEYRVKLDNLNSSLNNTLSSAKSYTNSEITKVDNKINSEISRAKTSETNLSDRIDNLEEGLTNALNEAKEYTDSEVKNNTNKINILNGTGEGSVKKTVKDEISNLVGTAPEKLDTLQEIADYLEEHEDMASGLVNSLSELETKKADKTELTNLKTETDSTLQSLDKIKANTTGYYSQLHVGTADDLAGRGESVPAEFGFRASGGKSIKDGRAYIKRIKGNSVVWNQLYKPVDAVIRTQIINGVTFSVYEDGTIEANGTAEGGSAYITLMQYTHFLASHKYILIAVGAPVGKWYNQGFYFTGISGLNTSSMIDAEGYKIFQPSADGESGLNFTCWEGYSLSCKFRPMFVDLTKAFPNDWENINTIEDFNARVATLGVDMNAYNEGEVIHMNTESIKSVGDNAWDEEWELGYYRDINGLPVSSSNYIRNVNFIRVLSNSLYYCTTPLAIGTKSNVRIFYYDINKEFIGVSSWLNYSNLQFTTPTNCAYINFTIADISTYDHDFTISLYHSGWKAEVDNTYKPYWQDILPLPIIRKYFPDGMKSAGTAHDEIRYNKGTNKWEAVKMIGSVDLGDLSFTISTAYDNTSYNTPLTDAKVNYSSWNVIPNLCCSRYSAGTPNSASGIGTEKDVISLMPQNKIAIAPSKVYNSIAELKADLQGVILYYELAEPIVTELDAEDQNFRDYYNVADFGTEMSQSSVPSAPFSADIIYQFNAVDMIREHEIEITELQKVIATMQAQLASLTSN